MLSEEQEIMFEGKGFRTRTHSEVLPESVKEPNSTFKYLWFATKL